MKKFLGKKKNLSKREWNRKWGRRNYLKYRLKGQKDGKYRRKYMQHERTFQEIQHDCGKEQRKMNGEWELQAAFHT